MKLLILIVCFIAQPVMSATRRTASTALRLLATGFIVPEVLREPLITVNHATNADKTVEPIEPIVPVLEKKIVSSWHKKRAHDALAAIKKDYIRSMSAVAPYSPGFHHNTHIFEHATKEAASVLIFYIHDEALRVQMLKCFHAELLMLHDRGYDLSCSDR